jgi:hypothetical protein
MANDDWSQYVSPVGARTRTRTIGWLCHMCQHDFKEDRETYLQHTTNGCKGKGVRRTRRRNKRKEKIKENKRKNANHHENYIKLQIVMKTTQKKFQN